MDLTRTIVYFDLQNRTEYWEYVNDTWVEVPESIGQLWEISTYHYFEMTCTQDEYANRNKTTIPV
jgi:hypothetical protein